MIWGSFSDIVPKKLLPMRRVMALDHFAPYLTSKQENCHVWLKCWPEPNIFDMLYKKVLHNSGKIRKNYCKSYCPCLGQ